MIIYFILKFSHKNESKKKAKTQINISAYHDVSRRPIVSRWLNYSCHENLGIRTVSFEARAFRENKPSDFVMATWQTTLVAGQMEGIGGGS